MKIDLAHLVFLVIVLHLLNRYGFASNQSFLLIDLLLFIAAKSYLDRAVALALGSLLAVFLLQTLFTHQNLLLTYLGLRPIILFLLTINFCKNLSTKEVIRLNHVLKFFLLFTLTIAIAQLFAGKTHPISALPDGFNAETVFGHEKETEFITFFRPTSIFGNTGKFGQVSWFICFMLIACANILKQNNELGYFQVLTIVISQQKAALTLIPIIFASMRWRKITVIVVVMFLLFALTPQDSKNNLYILYEVLISGKIEEIISQIPIRLHENLIAPSRNLPFLFFGDGIGIYSAGSANFGGKGFFAAENSIMRMFYEQGVLIILTLFWILAFLVQTWSRINNKASRVYFVLFFAILIPWSMTHDVFGSFLNCIFVGMFLSLVGLRKKEMDLK